VHEDEHDQERKRLRTTWYRRFAGSPRTMRASSHIQ
jgi:hypothetical protein